MQQVRFTGFGGQGIVVAGEILARAANLENKTVSLFSSYGSQVRGGIAISDLIISSSFIDCPLVDEIDFLVVMLQDAFKESISLVKKEGKIVLDSTLVKADSLLSSINYYSIPATEIALQELKSEMTANIILLSAANYIGKFVKTASLIESIKENFSPRFVELNLKGVEIGLKLAQKY